MLDVYKQMEADGKIGPLAPPDASGMRHQRPFQEYPKMLRPPKFERQEKLEPGAGGHLVKMYQYVQVGAPIIVRSRREELEFLATGAMGDEPQDETANLVQENRDLRTQNEDMQRRLERLEALLLAGKVASSPAPPAAMTSSEAPATGPAMPASAPAKGAKDA